MSQIEILRLFIIGVSILFALGMISVHKRRIWWVGFEFAASYVLLNVLAALYILTHPMDTRWYDEQSHLNSPNLPGGQLLGPVTDPLNSFFGSVTGSINELLALKSAIIVSQEFLLAAGIGLLFALPLLVVSIVISRGQKKREMQRFKKRLQLIERRLGVNSTTN